MKDPSCAIAYWGVAMSRWGNPFSIAIKPPAQLLPGRTAIERGRMVGAKSERERDYVAAVAALYDNFERVDQRTRMLAYRDAMGRAAAKYPDDTETSAFYALAHWRTREGAQAFFEEWEIDAEPGEVAIALEGDVGLVPLGGD